MRNPIAYIVKQRNSELGGDGDFSELVTEQCGNEIKIFLSYLLVFFVVILLIGVIKREMTQ